MRREYVKPMIESEEFVANEYVAACWTITCDECGFVTVQDDDYQTATDIPGVQLETNNGYFLYTYGEEINGKYCNTETTHVSNKPTWWGNKPFEIPELIADWIWDTFFSEQFDSQIFESYHFVSVEKGIVLDNQMRPNASF